MSLAFLDNLLLPRAREETSCNITAVRNFNNNNNNNHNNKDNNNNNNDNNNNDDDDDDNSLVQGSRDEENCCAGLHNGYEWLVLYEGLDF